ncbi:MAG: hypothetical protein HZB51_34365 [Chloroflexi bacterium]|nr:hypothetical protein [Chloroflexota bacterium]
MSILFHLKLTIGSKLDRIEIDWEQWRFMRFESILIGAVVGAVAGFILSPTPLAFAFASLVLRGALSLWLAERMAAVISATML